MKTFLIATVKFYLRNILIEIVSHIKVMAFVNMENKQKVINQLKNGWGWQIHVICVIFHCCDSR